MSNKLTSACVKAELRVRRHGNGEGGDVIRVDVVDTYGVEADARSYVVCN